MKGILIRFMDERHFGFIKYEGGEIFAHEFNFEYSPIFKGDKVEFELGTFKGRSSAMKIRLSAPASNGGSHE
jgi:cold shock CspA family protein